MRSGDLTVRNLPDSSTELIPHSIRSVRLARRPQPTRDKLDTIPARAPNNLPNNLTIEIGDYQRILHHCKSNTTSGRHRSETIHDRSAHNKTIEHFLHPTRKVPTMDHTNIGSPLESLNTVLGQRDLTGNEHHFTQWFRVNVEPQGMRKRPRRLVKADTLNGSAGMQNNGIMGDVTHKVVPNGLPRNILPRERVNVQLGTASPHSYHHAANLRPARRHHQSRMVILVNMETMLISQSKNAIVNLRYAHHGSQSLTDGMTVVREFLKIGGYETIGQKNILPIHYLDGAVQPNTPRPIRDVNGEMRAIKHGASSSLPSCLCYQNYGLPYPERPPQDPNSRYDTKRPDHSET
nr:MAG TPA: hypothetical protein [Caudoviricetes sp.]